MAEETCRYTGKPLSQCRCKKGCAPTTVTTNEWIQPIRRNYRMICCDCGLVHLADFRIHRGRVQFRMRREGSDMEISDNIIRAVIARYGTRSDTESMVICVGLEELLERRKSDRPQQAATARI